ncbi:MAG: hypothetical protein LBJ31_04270 [Treponema sp.]|nr:hypothetical protein [Treponema sp.]
MDIPDDRPTRNRIVLLSIMLIFSNAIIGMSKIEANKFDLSFTNFDFEKMPRNTSF